MCEQVNCHNSPLSLFFVRACTWSLPPRQAPHIPFSRKFKICPGQALWCLSEVVVARE